MGESRRKQTERELMTSLITEINAAIDRYIQRRGENPTRIFIGKLETALVLKVLEADPHKKCLSGTKLSIPIWTMKSATTMVDVG